MNDNVNHPSHYTNHPSGVECIQITEHMGFNLGNAVKYIWRADLKNDAIEDLSKAAWYLNREIKRRNTSTVKSTLVEDIRPDLPRVWVNEVVRLGHSGKLTPEERRALAELFPPTG